MSRRQRRSMMSEQLKNELAKDLGFYDTVQREGWGGIKAKDAGNMVKRAIQLAEQAAAKQTAPQQAADAGAGPQAGYGRHTAAQTAGPTTAVTPAPAALPTMAGQPAAAPYAQAQGAAVYGRQPLPRQAALRTAPQAQTTLPHAGAAAAAYTASRPAAASGGQPAVSAAAPGGYAPNAPHYGKRPGASAGGIYGSAAGPRSEGRSPQQWPGIGQQTATGRAYAGLNQSETHGRNEQPQPPQGVAAFMVPPDRVFSRQTSEFRH